MFFFTGFMSLEVLGVIYMKDSAFRPLNKKQFRHLT